MRSYVSRTFPTIGLVMVRKVPRLRPRRVGGRDLASGSGRIQRLRSLRCISGGSSPTISFVSFGTSVEVSSNLKLPPRNSSPVFPR